MFIIAKTVTFNGDAKLKESKVTKDRSVRKREKGKIARALQWLVSIFV